MRVSDPNRLLLVLALLVALNFVVTFLALLIGS